MEIKDVGDREGEKPMRKKGKEETEDKEDNNEGKRRR